MISKADYEIARASGTLELLRSDKISSLIRNGHSPNSPRYTLGAELRLGFNLRREPENPKYIAEFEEHEAYVDECKAIVDAEMLAREEEYLNEIHNT